MDGHVALDDHMAGEDFRKGDFGVDCCGGESESEKEAKVHGENLYIATGGLAESLVARERDYGLKTRGGPLTRFPWRSTVTSTRSAILMKGIPLFIP